MVVRGIVFGHRHQSGGRSECVSDLFNVFSLMLLVVLNCHFVCFNWPCSNLLACTM